MKIDLLASAPTAEAIRAAISKFYCGTEVSLGPLGPNVWIVVRKSDGATLQGVLVKKKARRFRFEATRA
jgi:hypothetical protein